MTLDNTKCYNVVHDGDDRDTVVGSLRKKQQVEHTLARYLLKEVTGKAYHRLRTEILTETNLDKSKLQINLLTLDNTECYNVVHDGDD